MVRGEVRFKYNPPSVLPEDISLGPGRAGWRISEPEHLPGTFAIPFSLSFFRANGGCGWADRQKVLLILVRSVFKMNEAGEILFSEIKVTNPISTRS